MSGDLFPLPVQVRLSKPSQVAGVVIGRSEVDPAGRLRRLLLWAGKVLRGVEHFEARLETESVVEHFESVVAFGAARDEGRRPRIS